MPPFPAAAVAAADAAERTRARHLPVEPAVPAPAAWGLLVPAAAVAAYAVLSHVLMVHHAAAPWAVAALFGPLLAAVAASAWRGRRVWTLAACAVLALVLAWLTARGGVADVRRLYVLQHAAIHAVLAWTFAATLRPGHTPLISALARRVHRRFTPGMQHYTAALTRLWAAYFTAMIAVSAAIYAVLPWPWWSAFCNFATPLAALALFVGEHVWRYRRHPEFERVSLRGAWDAWRSNGSAGAVAAEPERAP